MTQFTFLSPFLGVAILQVPSKQRAFPLCPPGLHHETGLHVAHGARGVAVSGHVVGPFGHHHLEGVRVDVHDIFQGEETMLGHP